MTYEEAMEAIGDLEGLPVAVDTIINKLAPALPGVPETKPGLQDDQMVGVLELRDIPVPGDTPADEAVWWYRREGKAVVGIAGVNPDGGFLVSRDRFQDAHREEGSLVLKMGGISWRVVPLVRCDGLPLKVDQESRCLD
jgi:hypothetical protein